MKTSEFGHGATKGNHPNTEQLHECRESFFCLLRKDECVITVEIHASSEEHQFLVEGIQEAFSYLNTYFDGKFVEYFKGLEVEIGDDLTEGAGEAFGGRNKIVLDRRKMLMTIAEADSLLADLGWADCGDRTRALPVSMHRMTAATYELVHELGHIVEERADLHLPKLERLKRASALSNLSPTNLYHRDPLKPQEAFAEGFAYQVFGQEINPELAKVVDETTNDFIIASQQSIS